MENVNFVTPVGNLHCLSCKHSTTIGSAVPLVGDPDWHNSLGRPGLPLESVWHHMQSYLCPGATQAMECTLVVLKHWKKSPKKQTWPSSLKCLVSLDSA